MKSSTGEKILTSWKIVTARVTEFSADNLGLVIYLLEAVILQLPRIGRNNYESLILCRENKRLMLIAFTLLFFSREISTAE